ncbi:hypothetical protein C8R43DRAFT_959151 [Mycena crocata]|nr:hypothetical protein C8R43DRAFT_959151 [Mycena crocata]
MQTPFPATIQVSLATRTNFSSDKSSIVWDPQFLQIIRLHDDIFTNGLGIGAVQELHFEGEEIADVSSSGDDLLVLTRTATGADWGRPWKRRFNAEEDHWKRSHPLHKYTIRTFSLKGRLQIGDVIQLQDPGVHATIRSGFHKAVVRLIGPRCVSSFWEVPTNQSPEWKILHEELSWVIAGQMGFTDAEAELSASAEEGSMGEDKRYRFKDKEILDYVFLAPSIILRLLEEALDRADTDFDIEAFSLDTGFNHGMEPFEAPAIFTLPVAGSDTTIEMSSVTISTDDPSGPNSPNFVVIAMVSDNPCARVILKVSTLLDYIWHPSTLADAYECAQNAECLREEWRKVDFLRHTRSWWNSTIGPSIHGNVVFLPIADRPRRPIDAEPLVRFIRIPEDGTRAQNIDIAFSALAPSIPQPIPGFSPGEYALWPPIIAAWDGADILCVIVRADPGPHRRDYVHAGFYVKVDPSLQCAARGACGIVFETMGKDRVALSGESALTGFESGLSWKNIHSSCSGLCPPCGPPWGGITCDMAEGGLAGIFVVVAGGGEGGFGGEDGSVGVDTGGGVTVSVGVIVVRVGMGMVTEDDGRVVVVVVDAIDTMTVEEADVVVKDVNDPSGVRGMSNVYASKGSADSEVETAGAAAT